MSSAHSPSTTTVALAALAGGFGSLDTAVNIAFPDLLADLGLVVGDLQWVVVCYVLAYGGLLLAGGQLGDSIGHDRVLSYGAGVSVAGLLACAVAPVFGVLLVARIVQGVGAAMVMASAPALLTTGSAGRGRAIGIFQTAAGVGLAVGPIVGGPLVEAFGWRGVFWFRVPIGVLLALVALAASSPDGETEADVDRLGVLSGSIALGGAVLALNLGRTFGWTHAAVLAAGLVTVGAGVGFVASCRRSPNPVIDVSLFKTTRFTVANLLAVLANGATFATWLLVPSLLIDRLDLSLVIGGLVLAASPILTAAVSPFAGRRSDRTGPEGLVVGGLGMAALGMAGLATIDTDSSVLWVTILMAMVGAGLGLFSAPNMAMVMGSLADSKQGVAGGLSLMTRTLGIVTGVAAASSAFDAFEPERGFAEAFSIVFLASAAVLTAAAGLAFTQLAFTSRPAR